MRHFNTIFFGFNPGLIVFLFGALWLSNPTVCLGQQQYAFAYFYGNDETLLITPVVKFNVSADADIGPETQIYMFTRDNGSRFKSYLRNRYPSLAEGLTPQIETIIVSPDASSLTSRRDFMINQNGDNRIEIDDFDFILDPIKRSQPINKPQ